ncbi:MAG: DUF1826 domain-containing protein [Bdellovibrionales bacterium]|nr:DUF1826 domain-containing protein [Bdellovibrionales bacterium]
MSLAIVCPVVKERSRLLEQQLAPLSRAKKVLDNPNTNLFLIDGSFFLLPSVEGGRDFEITILLDSQNPASFRRFVRALPKRFGAKLNFWSEYVETMTKRFCQAFDVRYAKLRFSQISHDQCPLFHTDYVTVRLFQTLNGPGTEYVSDDNLNRDGLGKGCNSKIVLNYDKVKRANTKDILLMRGDRWFEGKGLAHRSPPIEQLGLNRLYLCLDAVKDPSLVRY